MPPLDLVQLTSEELAISPGFVPIVFVQGWVAKEVFDFGEFAHHVFLLTVKDLEKEKSISLNIRVCTANVLKYICFKRAYIPY